MILLRLGLGVPGEQDRAAIGCRQMNIDHLAIVNFSRALRADGPKDRGKWIYVGLLAATLVIGFVNALVHAKDGWASMPLGLILSLIVLVLTLATIWAAFAAPRTGAMR